MSTSRDISADHWITYFFFFQAEDGIRDLIVTGVQTCALPIYSYVADGCRTRAVVEVGSNIGIGSARLRREHRGIALEPSSPAQWHTVVLHEPEIGRASCRERV